MKQENIVCDKCGSDLSSHETPATEFRLVLDVETIKRNSEYAYEAMYYPPISGQKHFCDLKCLKDWVNG